MQRMSTAGTGALSREIVPIPERDEGENGGYSNGVAGTQFDPAGATDTTSKKSSIRRQHSTENQPSSMPYIAQRSDSERLSRSLEYTPLSGHRHSRRLSTQTSQLGPQASFLESAQYTRRLDSIQTGADSGEDGVCVPFTTRVDGGWAWVVLLASFFMTFLVDGIVFSTAVYLKLWEVEFHAKEVTFISAVITGVYLISAPIVSTLTEVFGFRSMAIVGSSIATLGLLGSSFAHNFPTMVITYGLLGGFGCCFLYVTAMVGASLYFDRWRSIAVGFTACGSGTGIMVFSVLLSYLLEDVRLDWRHCIRIEAACFASGILLALTFLPLPTSSEITKRTFLTALKSSFDPKLFKKASFWLLNFGAFFAIFGLSIPPQMFTLAGADRQLSDRSSNQLVTIFGAANALGRLLVGAFVFFVPLNPLLVLSVGLLLGGLVNCLAVYYTDMALLSVFAALHGVVFAMDAALATVIIVRILGREKLAGAFGVLCMFRGVAGVFGAPIAEKIQTVSKDFDAAFYLAGAAIIMTGLLNLANWVINRNTEQEEDIGSECEVEDAETIHSPLLHPTGEHVDNYGGVQRGSP